ncbi:MAG: hypothetical protein ACRD3V_13025 [Vicinamibacteria bacterium]
MKRGVLWLILLLVLAGCSNEGRTTAHPTWQLVYQHDLDGNPLIGEVEDLINAMKGGSPIRVSWGGTVAADSSWIEFAEPVFVTVMNDNAVVVQFPLSFIQTDYVDPGEAFLQTDPPTGWRALMSTNGNYHQFHYDLRTGAITRIMFARTQASWFALVPPREGRPVPDLTPTGAFELDSVITPDGAR